MVMKLDDPIMHISLQCTTSQVSCPTISTSNMPIVPFPQDLAMTLVSRSFISQALTPRTPSAMPRQAMQPIER